MCDIPRSAFKSVLIEPKRESTDDKLVKFGPTKKHTDYEARKHLLFE
jgi:hypothetical protein